MRRLARLDVSLDMALHLALLWLLARGAIRLLATHEVIGCGTLPTLYAIDMANRLQDGLGWGLGLVVLGVAWLETRAPLRPWFKRVLRLSGPSLMASMLVPFWLFRF